MTRLQTFHRLRFADPEVDASAGGHTYPDRWYTTQRELENAAEALADAFLVPRGAAWSADTATFEVDDLPATSVTVFLEEERGAIRWIWTPARDPDDLVAFWRALPSMEAPGWLAGERAAGRLVEAVFFGAAGYARTDGRVVYAARPWTAHVWRDHDSWLRPPVPTLKRYMHRGAVLHVMDDAHAHFLKAQAAFRETGACGRLDFSPHAFVFVPDEPFGEGHMCAGDALYLGASVGIDGPAMRVRSGRRTRVVPAQRTLQWDGTAFVCVPA